MSESRKISLGPTVEQQDAAMARLKKRTRKSHYGARDFLAFCSWCGETQPKRYGLDEVAQMQADVREHARDCRANPAVAERDRFRTALEFIANFDCSNAAWGKPCSEMQIGGPCASCIARAALEP